MQSLHVSVENNLTICCYLCVLIEYTIYIYSIPISYIQNHIWQNKSYCWRLVLFVFGWCSFGCGWCSFALGEFSFFWMICGVSFLEHVFEAGFPLYMSFGGGTFNSGMLCWGWLCALLGWWFAFQHFVVVC